MSRLPKPDWDTAHLSKAATVNVPFEATVKFADKFVPSHAEGLEVLNLAFDVSTATVSGTPNRAGSFDILVHGYSDDAACKVVFTLPINPDPSTLWKNLPSDPEGLFARADTACSTLAEPTGARWIAASRRGRRHAHRGDYRDDAYHLCSDAPSGWSVAAVADGAGSAELSREGARIAASTAAMTLCDTLAKLPAGDEVPERSTLLSAAVASSLQAAFQIETAAGGEACDYSAFSTTLLLGAARRYADYWLFISFSIGDGVIASWHSDTNTVQRMCSGDGGEFAGETRFLAADMLTDVDACDDRLFVEQCEQFSAFVLMSDGVSDPQFVSQQSESCSDAWRHLWSNLTPALQHDQPENKLLEWLDFQVPGEHDDRTIALLIP